jgi:hypothetical protein
MVQLTLDYTVARLRTIEWDAVAGLVAAVVALVLHFLHVVEQDTLLAIILMILALTLLRSLRRERLEDRLLELLRVRMRQSPMSVLPWHDQMSP